MTNNDLVKKLREETGCGFYIAKKALELRENNFEFAKEYVNRHNLAAIMADHVRYPLWTAFLEQRSAIRNNKS